MRENLNVRPFTIAHNLTHEPLFQLPRLIELARALPESDVEYNAGDLPVELDPSKTPRNGLSIAETLHRIETCRSWMALKWVERDPSYGALLRECLDQIDMPGMKRREGFVFVTSPASVTPFHFDQEYNFLLQIRGTKTVHVFPPSIITEEEVEERFALSHRNLRYREHFDAAATVFELKPGDGLHIPIAAPHWVKNGDNVSVSFSITFQTPASEKRSALYRINSHIRKFGLKPKAVGTSQVRDGAKYFAFQGLRYAARMIRPKAA
jgi:hypothetical protein